MDSGERFGVADAHIARRGVECPGQSGKRPSALPLLKLRAIVCAAIGPVAWGAELPDVVRLAKPLRQTYLAQRTVTLAIVRVVVDRDRVDRIQSVQHGRVYVILPVRRDVVRADQPGR